MFEMKHSGSTFFLHNTAVALTTMDSQTEVYLTHAKKCAQKFGMWLRILYLNLACNLYLLKLNSDIVHKEIYWPMLFREIKTLLL